MSRISQQYNEDLFAETRMSFGDHLEELRSHLIRAFLGFLVGMFASFFIGDKLVAFIGQPVELALQRYYDERAQQVLKEVRDNPNTPINDKIPVRVEVAAKQWYDAMAQANPDGMKGVPAPAEEAAAIHLELQMENPVAFAYQMQHILQRLGKRPALTSLSAQEAFMVYFKVCIITGFVISSPWVFYQIWAFVAAGLYPHEKKYVNLYLPFSIFLFLGGVGICEIFIIPRALDALLAFNRWMSIEPDFRLNEWLSFAIWMPVITGLCFQTPLVMMFLGKLGIFTPEDFAAKRRIAIFIMLVLAAIVSPSVDPASLLLMWVPMVLLYELGIVLVKLTGHKSEIEDTEVEYNPDEHAPSNPSGNGDGAGTA